MSWDRREILIGDGVANAFDLSGPIDQTSERILTSQGLLQRDVHYSVSTDGREITFAQALPDGERAVCYYREA